MIGPTLALLRRIFAKDILVRIVPAAALITGAILFVMAYLIVPETRSPAWHDALKTLAQIILVSGVVSVIVNSVKYMGIFKEAVHEVVFGPDHLRSRKDLPDIWSVVTSILCQDKFPDLSRHLHTAVLGKYIPTAKNFYYSDYDRECTFKWEDKENGIVVVQEEIELTINPANQNEKIVYTYVCNFDSRSNAIVSKLELNDLRIDGRNYPNALKFETYDDEFGGKGTRYSYSFDLQGKKRYRVRRSITRRLPLLLDPVTEYSSLEFILDTTVKFRSETSDLKPIFVSVGTDDFEDLTFPKGHWQVHRELKGLMFPRQGYILFIQNVPEEIA
jgi:hypothetical protein